MDKSMEHRKALEAIVADYLFRPRDKDVIVEWKKAATEPILMSDAFRTADKLTMNLFGF